MVPSARVPQRHLSNRWMISVCAITVILWSGSFVTSAFGAPAKPDAIAPPPHSPFPLEAQPALFTNAFSSALNSYNKNNGDGNSGGKSNSGFLSSQPSAIDSYGNPIETLKPIDTPDGRKVISAQGLQFEIPNYASGITEIKKPADDLLPPFIGELNNNTNNKNTNFSAPNSIIKLNTNLNTNRQQNQNEQPQLGGKEELAFKVGKIRVNKDVNTINKSDDQHVLDKLNAETTDLNTDNNNNVKFNAETAAHVNTSKTNDWNAHTATVNKFTETDFDNSANKLVLGHNDTYTPYNRDDVNLILESKLLSSEERNPPIERPATNSLIPINNTNTIITITPIILDILTKPSDATQPFTKQLLNYNRNSTKNTLVNLSDAYSNNLDNSTTSLPLKSLPAPLIIDHHTDTKPDSSQPFVSGNDTNKIKKFIRQTKNSYPTAISHKQVPATPPLSSGNFNYPNVPTDQAVINRIAAKYQNPLPTLDPIAVAVSNDAADGTYTASAGSTVDTAATAITTTTVDVENAELVELKPQQWNTPSQTQKDRPQKNGTNSLPSYIVELNDPDIDGPVEYMPGVDGSALKVIAWDLLPPIGQDSQVNTPNEDPIHQNAKVSLTAGQNLRTDANLLASVTPATNSNRGNIYYTSSTTTTPRTTSVRTTSPKTTTTTTTKATTTTSRPNTKPTRRAPTSGPTTTTTTTTTAAPLNPDEFYQLEHGDSYTLPAWLADIDDPELDAAVTYIVPENILEYNDTISRELLPPFEPYIDLNNIDLPAPLGEGTTTSTTKSPRTKVEVTSKHPITTSTASHPAISTPKPNWVRSYPTTESTRITTTTMRPHSFDDRFSSNNIAQSHDPKIISPSTFQNFNTTTFVGNSALSTTTTTSTEVEGNQTGGKFQISNSNPFLSTQNIASSAFASVNAGKLTTTTTTTTTTTIATPIEENPFNSATLPSWLKDFDYPDLAAGVPFLYNEENSKSDVFNDLLPPSQAANTTNPTFITSSPTSFNSFQTSSSSAIRHESTLASAFTSTPRNFASNNFPSKITTTAKPSNIHNPFARRPSNNKYPNHQEGVVTTPPVLLDPPTANGNDVNDKNPQTGTVNFNTFNHQQPELQLIPSIPSSSSFNTNFAAPFETATESGSAIVPISTDLDFGSSTKTTFTKSNEGKVITNNGLGASSSVTTPSKQFGSSTSTTTGQAQKGSQQSLSNQFLSSTNSFANISPTLNKGSTPTYSTFGSTQPSTTFGGFNKGIVAPATNAGAGKYTGSFGGSPGVLGNGKVGYAVQADGSIRLPSTDQVASPVLTSVSKQPTSPSVANRFGVVAPVGLNKFQGSFGGPPGVLVPFDNTKSG